MFVLSRRSPRHVLRWTRRTDAWTDGLKFSSRAAQFHQQHFRCEASEQRREGREEPREAKEEQLVQLQEAPREQSAQVAPPFRKQWFSAKSRSATEEGGAQSTSTADSHVARGARFEELALRTLQLHSFVLTRCGKPGDRGVDLRGEWRLPELSVPVFVQCKKTAQATAGKELRELDGALASFRCDAQRIEEPLALFVCAVGYSPGALDYLHHGTRVAMALAVIDEAGDLLQLQLNELARRLLPHLVLGRGYRSQDAQQQPQHGGLVTAGGFKQTLSLFYRGRDLHAAHSINDAL